MKNIKSLFVLICSVALIMGSCAKKDDEETVAVVAGTGTGNTASGTISGIDYLTGTFTMSFNGQTPSGGCIDNSTAITALSSALPSGTLGFKFDIIIGNPPYNLGDTKTSGKKNVYVFFKPCF